VSYASPPKLVAALKELSSRRVFVPPTLDEAILGAARQHLAKPHRSGFKLFRGWLVFPATATACLLLAGLGYFVVKQSGAEFAREDINRDGQVDILDAFQLARGIQTGVSQSSGMDLNGDGVVDRRDAEIIAVKAVKLEKGGRS